MPYTEEIADEICRLTVDSSVGLKHICLQLRQPYDTVKDWIYKNQHGFADKYARAKQLQAERIDHEILLIADDDGADAPKQTVQRARLRIDTRKWLKTNLAPHTPASQFLDTKLQSPAIIIRNSQQNQFPPDDQPPFQILN